MDFSVVFLQCPENMTILKYQLYLFKTYLSCWVILPIQIWMQCIKEHMLIQIANGFN